MQITSKNAKDTPHAGGNVAILSSSVDKHSPLASPRPLARTHDMNAKRNRNRFPDWGSPASMNSPQSPIFNGPRWLLCGPQVDQKMPKNMIETSSDTLSKTAFDYPWSSPKSSPKIPNDDQNMSKQWPTQCGSLKSMWTKSNQTGAHAVVL